MNIEIDLNSWRGEQTTVWLARRIVSSWSGWSATPSDISAQSGTLEIEQGVRIGSHRWRLLSARKCDSRFQWKFNVVQTTRVVKLFLFTWSRPVPIRGRDSSPSQGSLFGGSGASSSGPAPSARHARWNTTTNNHTVLMIIAIHNNKQS